MPMLDQLITQIVTGAIPTPHKMRGGARLDWNADTRLLSACRLNAPVPANEARTFERFIADAGYTHGKRREMRIFEGSFGDSWVGVAWEITPTTQPEASQASLFAAADLATGEEIESE
jgi:hypothetical protein